MNTRVSILSFIDLLVVPAFAREESDVIVMKNGDRLTGEIKSLDSGLLHFSVDYIDGDCSIRWSMVDHLESKQLFVVMTENGSVYAGTLRTAEVAAGQPMRIQISEGIEPVKILPQSQIVLVIQTSDKFWRRFNGAINSGIIYAKGNQTTQHSLSSSVEYPRPRWSASASIDSSLSSSSGSTVSTRNSLTTNAQHLLRWNNWYYTGYGTNPTPCSNAIFCMCLGLDTRSLISFFWSEASPSPDFFAPVITA